MPDPPVAPGELLAGKYLVERLLGEGGHGVVVAAQHVALGERVAIKVLRPEVAQDQETVARFVREARASVRIKGEHVARVLDVGSLPSGLPYMVMEHLEGADLSAVIEQKGWLPIATAVDYVLQTCEALAEAHALGIVHRDIKPSNLFLTTRPDGSPCIKVLDFGISKAMPGQGAGPEMNLTQTQSVLGSPQYMAPEQMRSSKRVDGRTDIWALGTTLHELLTGHPPFDASTMPELFAMILQDPAPRLGERRPGMPPALEVAVARCLEKEPEKRFADVYELARALAPLGSSTGNTAVERISRVAFNTARSTDRIFPVDGGSAPGVDLSRTERDVRTATNDLPSSRRRWTFGFAAIAAFMAVVGVAGIVIGLQRIRASTAAGATTASEASLLPSPPSPSLPPSPPLLPSEAPPPVVVPTIDETAPPAPSEMEPAASASPTASAGASGTSKRPELRPKAGPVASAQHGPPAAAASGPTVPPATATATTPPRAPGVASSRYD